MASAEEEVDALISELFASVDTAGSGKVGVDDLRPMLEALAPPATDIDALLSELFGATAADAASSSSSAIDGAAFCAGLRRVVDSRVASVFEACDRDDDGLLSPEELAEALPAAASEGAPPAHVDLSAFKPLFLRAALHLPASSAKAKADVPPLALAAATPPHTPPRPASLSLSPAAQGYVLEAQSPRRAQQLEPRDARELRAAGLSDAEIDAARTAFDAVDGDGDGALGRDDLRAALGGDAAAAAALLAFFDREWRGSAGFAEFARAVHELRATTEVDAAATLLLPPTAPDRAQRVHALLRAVTTTSPAGTMVGSVPLASPRGSLVASPAAKAEVERMREEAEKLAMARRVAEEQLDTLQAQLSEVQAERDALRAKLQTLGAEQRAAVETSRAADRQAQELQEQADQLRVQLRDALDVNQSLRRQLKDLSERDAREAEILAAQQGRPLIGLSLGSTDALREKLDRATRERYERTLTEVGQRNQELERQLSTFQIKADATIHTLQDEARKLRNELAHSRVLLAESEDRVRIHQQAMKRKSGRTIGGTPFHPSSAAAAISPIARRLPLQIQDDESAELEGTSLGEELETMASKQQLESRISELESECERLQAEAAERRKQQSSVSPGALETELAQQRSVSERLAAEIAALNEKIKQQTVSSPKLASRMASSPARANVAVNEELSAALGLVERVLMGGAMPQDLPASVASVVALAKNVMDERTQLLHANETLSVELRGSSSSAPPSSSILNVQQEDDSSDLGSELRGDLRRANAELSSLRAQAAALMVRKVQADSRLSELMVQAQTLPSPTRHEIMQEVRHLREHTEAIAPQLEAMQRENSDLETPLISSVHSELARRNRVARRSRVLICSVSGIVGFSLGLVVMWFALGFAYCGGLSLKDCRSS